MTRTSTGRCPSRQYAPCWETVFDPGWTITVGGVTFGCDDLADIVFARSIGNKGFFGVAASSLTFSVYSELDVFAQGTAVTLDTQSLPTFYVENVESDGNVYRITAYDKCKDVDIPFDYSAYSVGNYYPTSQIVSAIAVQCGFSSGSGGYTAVPELGYLDLKGMTCRQILEELSKANCGWYQASGTALVFRQFSPPSAGSVISEDDRTEIQQNGVKNISALLVHDDISNTDYQTGQTSYTHIEMLSGRYMTQAVAQSVAGTIFGGGSYSYRGWRIASAVVLGIFGLGESISGGGMILDERYAFEQEIIAALGAPAPDLSFGQYQTLYQRMIDARAKLDTKYNSAQITREGLFAVPNEGA